MHNEVSELLKDAKVGAPPPRYGVDDVVMAGRRRLLRRQTGWAIVAVAAVSVAIGVPQLVTRRSAQPARPVPAVTTPAPARPFAFDYMFRGYKAGGLRVLDPSSAGLGLVIAEIQRIGAGVPHIYDAALEVYLPGVDPISSYPAARRTEVEPVNGRRAYVIRPENMPGAAVEPEAFAWEYTDGALAIVRPRQEALTRTEMRLVAEGLSVGGRRPATIPFKVSHVPSGFRLVSVSGSAERTEQFAGRTQQRAGATLVPAAIATQRLSRPDRSALPSETGLPPNGIVISLDPPADDRQVRPATTTCITFGSKGCSRWVAGGQFRLTVDGNLAEAEKRAVLESITMATVDQPGTWFAANAAFPAEAQLPGS